MMYIHKHLIRTIVFFWIVGPVFAQHRDIEGSQDHPLISRYEGSVIIDYETKAFDAFELLLGPNEGKDANLDEGQKLEGAVTKIRYLTPAGRSTLEVYRNYEKALERAGFEVLFSCVDRACGRLFTNIYKGRERDYLLRKGQDQRFLATRLSGSEADVYVSLLVNRHDVLDSFAETPVVQLDVIEIEPLEDGMVTVDDEALAGDLNQVGHAAVYGIYFDVDRAEVKAASEPALAEIARLLRQQPGLKLYVVGHTDNTGAFSHNMDLSRRRAEAVVEALVNKYGVIKDRLTPAGVGPVAPVSTNDSEKSRAFNRRVELVVR